MSESPVDTYPAVPTCRLPPSALRPLSLSMDARRRAHIAQSRCAWAGGTQIHYCFLNVPPSSFGNANANLDAVRRAFATWQEVGIDLGLIETKDPAEAEIRVAFEEGATCSSRVGTEALKIGDPSKPTMIFGFG